MQHYQPATASEADQAARRHQHEMTQALFLDPLFKGHYPEMLFEWIGSHAPRIQAGDMNLINQSIDFLGVNYHMTFAVRFSDREGMLKLDSDFVSAPNWGQTAMGWGINPPGLRATLLNLKENYGNPKIYITENGCAVDDIPR